MGKYQLDYKGMQQVERYHEKMQPSKMIKARVQALLKKLERRSNMILRRPSQTDKEAILEMMAEFERSKLLMMVDFGTPTILFMKSG